MSTQNISHLLRLNSAEQFSKSFFYSQPNVGYIFIGNPIPYANSDSDISILVDSDMQKKDCWNTMIAAKKITGNDLKLVIPNNVWVSGKIYNQYDDNIETTSLLSANSMYVIADNNVYKCLSNNYSSVSTSKPTGRGITGTIVTSDSYIWKYLYKIPEESAFLTKYWIPVPSSTKELEYSINENYCVPGEIATIVIDYPGSNYYNNTINVSSFLSACTVLTFDPIDSIANTLAINMKVSGTGIESGTYITSIDSFNRKIYLSSATKSSGGGPTNPILISTRSVIVGDGSDATVNTEVSNGQVTKIQITKFGKNYNYANVIIYGTGTNAQARAIISPKFGHGYNSAKDLGASSVMINMNFISDENGIISTKTTYRQYGLLVNPYKYNESVPINYITANSTISQTTDITLIESIQFNQNEFVYQGNKSNPLFSGIVNTVESNNIVKLINTKGTPVIGSLLIGSTEETSIGRTVIGIDFPEFNPYTGDILYIKNVNAIYREDGQIENIKFIVKF